VALLVAVGIGGKDSSSSTGSTIGTVADPAPVSSAPAPGKPAAHASLISRAGFAAALDRLRGRGRLRLLRVTAGRIDAQLVTRPGALRTIQITAGGALRDFGTAGSGAGALPTVPYAQIDPAAPARLVRAAARLAGRKPSRVDYLVLLMLPSGQSWNVYFKPDGLHFMADRHGRGLRRL
jgi:hypothetical protein